MNWMIDHAKKNNNGKIGHHELLWEDLKPNMIVHHTFDVIRYFSNSNRLKDVFVRDIENINYSDLADFLGVKPVKDKFPHLHKRAR